ncbi:hypothetical protein GGR21_003266 [Dysgonomonas hofstadii]|uniref:Uncharacterized protein n=1 Tax=Dysgonomonas hofstadii TaxID=637886 RepID=A0A840CRR2_9BACT|nr:hypothetical protein [Dysgonomonas hofstadii]
MAHPTCYPLQAHGLNGKIVLWTLPMSRPSHLTGAQHYGQMPPGEATSRQGNFLSCASFPCIGSYDGPPVR